ncbi:hypothetical protein COY16_04455 [Candidatus Roizmanbacteria bacterium CG_4_10_14_0_2_um_filter_39_13]|uniref:Uncharacterized protein n=1 Tax=Candidatus Roizmanbacteria bacterium CG_4_10_14_0_2_um_filter_39_13 TaxID=1974825 RepID=A0A2M7TXQ9_9BACT|nr:MAG: hypothetical protein COY16_04455 [Candidatus Roizmanbacteria bacterium CG_4_10_14_0_2_um_filter_39_13]
MLAPLKAIRTHLNHTTFNLFVIGIIMSRPMRVLAQIRDWNDLDGDDPASLPANAPGNTCLVNGVPTLKCGEVVIANLLFISNALVLLVLFVMFVLGSFRWMMSLGEPEKVENAKKTFTWAIIGLVVYASAYIILFTIDQLFLGGSGDIFRLKIGD